VKVVVLNLLGRHVAKDGGETVKMWQAKFEAPAAISEDLMDRRIVQGAFDVARDASQLGRTSFATETLKQLRELGLVMSDARFGEVRGFLEQHETEVQVLDISIRTESAIDAFRR